MARGPVYGDNRRVRHTSFHARPRILHNAHVPILASYGLESSVSLPIVVDKLRKFCVWIKKKYDENIGEIITLAGLKRYFYLSAIFR